MKISGWSASSSASEMALMGAPWRRHWAAKRRLAEQGGVRGRGRVRCGRNKKNREEEEVRVSWAGVGCLRLHSNFWLLRDAGDARTFKVM